MPSPSDDPRHDHEEVEELRILQGKASGLHVAAAGRMASHDKETAIHDGADSDEDDLHPAQSLLRPDSHLRQPSLSRRSSFLEEDEVASVSLEKPQEETQVTWWSLPQKDQLAVLTLARLAEPLTERGIQAYIFYQLRSFDTSLSDSQISSQAGMISAVFSGAQFLTAYRWGRASDSPKFGRKLVLMIGLLGTMVSCLGIGFAKSFFQVIMFRAIGGAMNGNVGVMRAMISEIVKEKKYQSRAFLLLPMCFNIGIIIGPLLGGILADPLNTFPSIFGENSIIGGKNGVGWMKTFPYLLPNLFSSTIVFVALLGIVLGIDETHYALKYRPDPGRKVGKYIVQLFRRRLNYQYTHLGDSGDDSIVTNSIDLENHPRDSASGPAQNRKDEPPPKRLPFLKMLNKNIFLTLTIHFLLAFHISAFNSLIFILLPAPRAPVPPPEPYNILRFTGGLGLSTAKVGYATAIIGVIGFPMQLFMYPPLHAKYGTLPSYRTFLLFSPLAYVFVPYLTLLPNHFWAVWPGLTAVLSLQVISRTFALPDSTILINNCSPSPAVLGTIHSVGQSVSAAARAISPILGGWALGVGFKDNFIIGVWWGMAGVAMLGWAISWAVFEGPGPMAASTTEERVTENPMPRSRTRPTERLNETVSSADFTRPRETPTRLDYDLRNSPGRSS